MSTKIFPKVPSRPLFHYTSAQGLMGILETQALWATHYQFLNDVSECRVLRQVLSPSLTEEIGQTFDALVKAKFLRELPNKLEMLEVENVFNAVYGATDKVAPFFVTSFCIHEKETEKHRDGLLSQWRGYANGGFAIEFDEMGLDQLILEEHKKYRYDVISTKEVTYNDYEKVVDIGKFAGLAKAMIQAVFDAYGKDVSPITGKGKVDSYIRPFLQLAPFLKDSGFAEENEYRIVAPCYRASENCQAVAAELGVPLEGDDFKPVALRTDKYGGLVPFIKLFDGLNAMLPITSILIGPHRNQAGQKAALELFLSQRQIEIPIRVSSLPFRD